MCEVVVVVRRKARMHGVVEHSTTSIYTPPKRAASAAALPEVTAITTDAELPKLLCSGRPHGSDPNECHL